MNTTGRSIVEAEADPFVGKVLCERFEIVSPIAAGGMGKVYRAIQRPLGRPVALKVLNARFDASKHLSFEERFFIEAVTTAKLRHPNTVMLLDYGRTEEGIYFMALELIDGESLQQLLVRSGPLPWARALAIGAQVARSLREAHLLDLVHRDLKPGNIMVQPEGELGDRVKVLDFGLVKCAERLADAAREGSGSLTEAGVVLGSPLYMAPEQARKQADQRSDIYSLGAVLFAAMAGRTPFVGKKPLELILKHMHEEPPRLATLADVPDDVDALVMKCLAKAPERRFQTMDELLLAVHQVVRAYDLGGLFVETTRTPALACPVAPRPQPPPRLPPPLPASVARRPQVPVQRAPRRRLLPSPRRWSRSFASSVLFGLGLAALTSVLAATGSSGPPAEAGAVSALEPPKEDLHRLPDVIPQLPDGTQPRRRLILAPSPDRQEEAPQRTVTRLVSPRATSRAHKPTPVDSSLGTKASPKPSGSSILRQFRDDPYE